MAGETFFPKVELELHPTVVKFMKDMVWFELGLDLDAPQVKVLKVACVSTRIIEEGSANAAEPRSDPH